MKRRAKEHQLLVWHQKFAKKDWRRTESMLGSLKKKQIHHPRRLKKAYFRPRITTKYAIEYDMALGLIHGLEWTGKGYKSLITGREI